MPEESKVVKINYSGNSHKQRDEGDKPDAKEQETAESPRVQKIEGISATVKKKSLGRKVAETFNGDDMGSVGSYILFEVLLPSAKDLAFDVITQGFERKLYGSSSPRSVRRGTGGGINYNQISKVASNLSSKGETIRDKARTTSGRQDYEDVVFADRGEAEQVLEQLQNVIEDYGVVRVADLHGLLGITGPFTDNKFGWADLNGVGIKYFRGSYIIDLPRPVQIN